MFRTQLNYLNCFCNWAKIFFLSLDEDDTYIYIEDDRIKSIRYLLIKNNLCPAAEVFQLKSLIDLCIFYQNQLLNFNVSKFEYNKKINIIKELYNIILYYININTIKTYNLNFIESTKLFKNVTTRILFLLDDNSVPVENLSDYI